MKRIWLFMVTLMVANTDLFTQGIPLDAPSAPLIRLIDAHHQHKIGTGFLLQLDLADLPAQTGQMAFQPVNSVTPTFVMERPDQRLPSYTRNPLVGLFKGLAAFGELARRPTQLPLPLQLILPLDSGVVLDEAGNLLVLKAPPTGRILLFIPQLLIEDGNRLYLILGAEGKTFSYVQSQRLYVDRTLPDVDLTLLAKEPGRYLGAQGQWVDFSYKAHVPPQLGSAGREMGIHLVLNDHYPMANPLPDGPAAWPSRNLSRNEMRCFVPDALARPDGSLELDVILTVGADESRLLSSRQKIVLQGQQPTQTLSLNFSEIVQSTKPAKTPADDYSDFYILYMLGGTCVHASDKAKDDLTTYQKIRWNDPLPAEIPLCPGDELGILICSRTPDWFYGGPYLFFQLTTSQFPKTGQTLEVTKKFKSDLGIRYRWTLRGTYEWLD